jgi:hypothetical protein
MAEEITFKNQVTWIEGAKGEITFPSDQIIEFVMPAKFGGIEGFLSLEDMSGSAGVLEMLADVSGNVSVIRSMSTSVSIDFEVEYK